MIATLHPQLEASGITADVAKRAGVEVVTSQAARDLGFTGNRYDGANLAGLAFPYRDPRTRALFMHRLRPEVAVDGRKYIQPTGTKNHLYLPLATERQLADVEIPAVVSEGEKKTLSIATVAGTRYLAIGVGGIWNWRTSDKEKRPCRDHGGTETVRVNSRPIEDLDWITWKGRRVFICFDSDGARNPDVARAEQALAAELRKRGAEPLVVSLAPGPDGSKRGIDDVLVAEPVERRLAVLERLLRSAAPRRRLAPDVERGLELAYQPASTLLRMFDAYCDSATDAPAVFRPFTGLATLAALVGRKVTAPFGAHDLTLNLYCCILAPSSFFHKTTMITIARKFASAVNPDVLLPDDFTPEKLIAILEKSSNALLLWPEFAGYLARSQRDYQGGSKELLMALYDSPDTFRRELQSKTATVKQPTLTILAAAATSYLADQLRGADLRSGFLNRFLFVMADRKAKSYAIPEPPDPALRAKLVTKFHNVSGITGRADLSGIRTPYTAWYRDVEREAARSDRGEILSAFLTRLSVTALKISVLLELANTGRLRVTPDSLEEALVLVDYIRAVLRHLLQVEFAESESEKALRKVLRMVQGRSGIKRGELLRLAHCTSVELDKVLRTLTERGDVYMEDRKYWAA